MGRTRRNAPLRSNRIKKRKPLHVKSKHQIDHSYAYDDDRACPGCCTNVCYGGQPGQCTCNCFPNYTPNGIEYDYDVSCNCSQGASIHGGMSIQNNNCAEHCGSNNNGMSYNIPCSCGYSVQYCESMGCGGSCGGSGGDDNPPAVCSEGGGQNYLLFSGQWIYVPGCECEEDSTAGECAGKTGR